MYQVWNSFHEICFCCCGSGGFVCFFSSFSSVQLERVLRQRHVRVSVCIPVCLSTCCCFFLTFFKSIFLTNHQQISVQEKHPPFFQLSNHQESMSGKNLVCLLGWVLESQIFQNTKMERLESDARLENQSVKVRYLIFITPGNRQDHYHNGRNKLIVSRKSDPQLMTNTKMLEED